MSKQGGIKDIAIGRSDTYRMDPKDLHIKPDLNSRVKNFDATDPDDLALAQSISQVGVKQNLTVFWENGKAFISDGHRRHGAVMYAIKTLKAEIASVPVQTEDRYSSEADRVFSQIVRNAGKPLAPIEQARVFKRLIDLGWTEKDIATKSGLNREWIIQLLDLQSAPDSVTSLVKDGSVAATLAITTLKKHKGDGDKAAKDLGKAVEKARDQGKTRATAKHMGEKPPSVKAQLKELFSNVEIRQGETSGKFGFIMDPDQYALAKSLIGFQVATDSKAQVDAE